MRKIKQEYSNAKLFLYNINKKYLTNLVTRSKKTTAYNIRLEEKMNDVSVLTFDMPILTTKINDNSCESLVKYGKNYYIIKTIDVTHSDGEKKYTITCYHEADELKGLTNAPIKPSSIDGAKTVEQLFDIIFENYTEMDLTSKYIFNGTDIEDTEKRVFIVEEETSIFENLINMAKLFDAYVTFENNELGKVLVSINSNPEVIDENKRTAKYKIVKSGINLKNIGVNIDSSNIFTRLVCYGKKDKATGNPLTIISANPTKQSYVEDYTYYTVAKGLPLEVVKQIPACIQKKIWEDESFDDAESLYKQGLIELSKVCKPIVTGTVSFYDLSAFEGTCKSKPKIGDRIYIIDSDTGYTLDCFIGGITRDFNTPENPSIDIANVLVYSNTIRDLTYAMEKANKNINDDGTINVPSIEPSFQILNEVNTDKLTAIEANIGTLNVNEVIADTIHANSANIANLQANMVDISDLTADKIKFNFGEGISLTLQELWTQFLSAGSTQTLHLTAENAVLDYAVIKDLITENLSVSDLLAGTINTGDITIQSDDGDMEIIGSLIQFKDDTGNVRIQIGKDAQGNFTFLVKDADGKATLYDGTGVHEGAIPDDLIIRRMVAPQAIGSKEIDYKSLVTGYNAESNVYYFNTSKLMYDPTGQMFNVVFNSLQQKVDNVRIGDENLLANSGLTRNLEKWLKTGETDNSITEERILVTENGEIILTDGVENNEIIINGTTATVSYDFDNEDFHVDLTNFTGLYFDIYQIIDVHSDFEYIQSLDILDMLGDNAKISLVAEELKEDGTDISPYTDNQVIISKEKPYRIFTTNTNTKKLKVLFRFYAGGNYYVRYAQLREGNQYVLWAKNARETISNLTTSFAVQQGKISELIANTTITKEDGSVVQLKDEYTSIVKTVNSINNTIAKHQTDYNKLTGRVTSVETKANVFDRNLDRTRSILMDLQTDGVAGTYLPDYDFSQNGINGWTVSGITLNYQEGYGLYASVSDWFGYTVGSSFSIQHDIEKLPTDIPVPITFEMWGSDINWKFNIKLDIYGISKSNVSTTLYTFTTGELTSLNQTINVDDFSLLDENDTNVIGFDNVLLSGFNEDTYDHFVIKFTLTDINQSFEGIMIKSILVSKTTSGSFSLIEQKADNIEMSIKDKIDSSDFETYFNQSAKDFDFVVKNNNVQESLGIRNLIVNGDFTNDLDGWTATGTNGSIETVNNIKWYLAQWSTGGATLSKSIEKLQEEVIYKFSTMAFADGVDVSVKVVVKGIRGSATDTLFTNTVTETSIAGQQEYDKANLITFDVELERSQYTYTSYTIEITVNNPKGDAGELGLRELQLLEPISANYATKQSVSEVKQTADAVSFSFNSYGEVNLLSNTKFPSFSTRNWSLYNCKVYENTFTSNYYKGEGSINLRITNGYATAYICQSLTGARLPKPDTDYTLSLQSMTEAKITKLYFTVQYRKNNSTILAIDYDDLSTGNKLDDDKRQIVSFITSDEDYDEVIVYIRFNCDSTSTTSQKIVILKNICLSAGSSGVYTDRTNEVVNGNTVINADGISVYNGAFKLYDSNNKNVFNATDDGNVEFTGKLQPNDYILHMLSTSSGANCGTLPNGTTIPLDCVIDGGNGDLRLKRDWFHYIQLNKDGTFRFFTPKSAIVDSSGYLGYSTDDFLRIECYRTTGGNNQVLRHGFIGNSSVGIKFLDNTGGSTESNILQVRYGLDGGYADMHLRNLKAIGDVSYGSLTANSSEKYKTNIDDISLDTCMDIVKNNDVKTYNLKYEIKDRIKKLGLDDELDLDDIAYSGADPLVSKRVGLIVEDLTDTAKTYLVPESGDGIDPYSMISILWKVVQNQQNVIEAQQAQITELQTQIEKINNLETRLKALEDSK